MAKGNKGKKTLPKKTKAQEQANDIDFLNSQIALANAERAEAPTPLATDAKQKREETKRKIAAQRATLKAENEAKAQSVLKSPKDLMQQIRDSLDQHDFIQFDAAIFALKKSKKIKEDVKIVVLSKINTNFSLEEIKHILEVCKINLAKDRFTHDFPVDDTIIKVSSSFTSSMVQLVYDHWKQGNGEQAVELLHFLKKERMPFISKIARDDVLIQSVMDHHAPKDFDFIKMILESGLVDVNTCITRDEDPGCHRVMTPFSIAFGAENLELLQLLLEHGADPYLANKTWGQIAQAEDLDIDIIIHSALGLEKKHPEEIVGFYVQVHKLIQDFFLKKLAESTEALEVEISSDELPEKQVETVEQIVPSTTNGPADEDLQETEIHVPASAKQEQILEQFIEYNNRASSDESLSPKLQEGRKFDALVLQYIQTEDEEILEEIYEFLSERSAEDDKSYINVLLELGASVDLAGEVLATKPQLLHRFCSVKKHIAAAEEPMGVMVTQQRLAPGIYQVPGKVIFLKLSDDVKARLDTGDCKNFGKKVLTQLEDPKFIAAKSLGLSGIKNYGKNIFKLKIAKVDANLVSTKSYIDESGNVLIEFDQILKHKEIKGIQGERVELENISHMIFAPMMEAGDEHHFSKLDVSLSAAVPGDATAGEYHEAVTGDHDAIDGSTG